MSSISRRAVTRLGLIAGAAAPFIKATDISKEVNALGNKMNSSSDMRSPNLSAWTEELPIPEVLKPVSSLSPEFQMHEPARDWWNQYDHQRCEEQGLSPQTFYEIKVRNTDWKFHKDLPPTPVFGYNSTVPGPTIEARYGEPFVLRVNNELDPRHQGLGMPDCALHLHNMHTPSESDGYPGDFVTPGYYRDHHYPMVRAGYDAGLANPAKFGSTNGDYREALGTLWYHDHRLDYTSQNVYKGMWGMCKVFDDYDTGDESTGLRLPSGPYDISLGFQDLQFDSRGQIFFNVFDTDGHLGDRVAVNGKIHPVLRAKPRRYRLRLLNSSPSRFYQFFLCKGDAAGNFKLSNNTWEPMMLIANDGNLLEAPYAVPPSEGVLMGNANRMDLVLDFEKYAGQTLYLVNRLHQDSGRGPSYQLLNPGTAVLKIVVDKDTSVVDNSLPVDPAYPVGAGIQRTTRLRPLPPIDMSEVKANRTWKFNRFNGAWTVNDQIVDLKVPRCTPKKGTAEVWTIFNNSGSWSHPVHIHFEEFQILSRNGRTPPPYERSRKDVLVLRPGEEVKIFIRFRDFVGQYVMHCHNVVHEDHAMMIRFDIVPPTTT